MASLIVKADIEAELMIVLTSDYSDAIITNVCTLADSRLKLRTNRTTFTGITADLAKNAEVCLAVDQLVRSNRDIVKVAIQSISENGSQITFNNGKTLATYQEDAESIIKMLTLPGSTPKYDLTFPSNAREITGDEETVNGYEKSILY